MKQNMFRAVSFMLAAALVIGTAVPVTPAYAGMIGTETAVAIEQGDMDRAAIQAVLEREDVRAQLVAHGVSIADAEARVAALSDVEARQLAAQIDQMPAGAANGWAIFGGILLILIITDLMGVTNVFPFINN